MKKILLIVFIVVLAVASFIYFINLRGQVRPVINENEEINPYSSLVACLAERGVIVYSSRFCPACINFANQFGGFAVISPIYVECPDYPERCTEEMQTEFVPEIQINGALYIGPATPESLAAFTGCEI